MLKFGGLLSVLTKAGLYSEPEMVTEQTGFFMQQLVKHKKTDAGKKLTNGNTLCIADGIILENVSHFSPPVKVGNLEFSEAKALYKLKNGQSWIYNSEVKQIAPGIQTEFTETKVMILREGKWRLGTSDELLTASIAAKSNKNTSSSKGTLSPGFLSSIFKIFSYNSNPLIGKWKSSVGMLGGMVSYDMEFDRDSMILDGKKMKVRYEIEDKTVTVYADGENVGLVLNIIDSNNFRVKMGLLDLQLTRIN